MLLQDLLIRPQLLSPFVAPVCTVGLQLLQPHQIPPLSPMQTVVTFHPNSLSCFSRPFFSTSLRLQVPGPPSARSVTALFGHVLTAPARSGRAPPPFAARPRAGAAPLRPPRAPPTGRASPPARPGDRRGGSSGMGLSPAARGEGGRRLPRFPRSRVRPALRTASTGPNGTPATPGLPAGPRSGRRGRWATPHRAAATRPGAFRGRSPGPSRPSDLQKGHRGFLQFSS